MYIEELYVGLDEAGRNLDLSLIDRLAHSSIESDLGAYTYPLDHAPEYRGWYRIGSGPEAGKASWVPKWSKYGAKRPTTTHGGSDLFGLSGTTVLAITGGTIEWRPFSETWGNHIYLYHRIGDEVHIAVYAHLDPSGAFSGRKQAAAGDAIGRVGCTGNAGNNGACWRDAKCNGKLSIPDHLHLELLVMDGSKVAAKKDPVATYGWTVRHAEDAMNAVCGSQEQQLPLA